MFCGECGTKNKKGSSFCEECGHKLETEEVNSTKKTTKNSKATKKPVKDEKPVKVVKPISKKNKIIIGSIIGVVVVLLGTYICIGNSLKPKNIATKYFKAYINRDADKLADTINLDESEFVSKKLLKKALKDEKKVELANYSVKDITKDGLSASVVIKYVEKGSSKEKLKTIKLVKNKKKKYLLFDNWSVDSSELVAKDYVFAVPKDSTPYINGIAVNKKYKSKSYGSYYDSYKIPSILKGSYDLTAKLESGLELQGTLKVNNNYGTASSSYLKLEKKTEQKLLKEVQDKMILLYDSAIEDKSFDDIKDKFEEDYRDDIENTYNNLKQNVSSDYNKLKEFKITDISLRNFSVSDDELQLTVQVKYNYKIEYKSLDETKEYSKNGKTSYVYATYKLDKKSYKLSNFKSLISYFSRYSY